MIIVSSVHRLPSTLGRLNVKVSLYPDPTIMTPVTALVEVKFANAISRRWLCMFHFRLQHKLLIAVHCSVVGHAERMAEFLDFPACFAGPTGPVRS